jgi:lysophospholipase L1-like esterase
MPTREALSHVGGRSQFCKLGDGVHPNEDGYDRMAGVWFEALQQYLR